MVPGERPIMYIDYKYNMQKVLYLMVTDNTGSKKAGLTYLSNHTEPFSNISICQIIHTLVMSKLFGCVIKVKPHNKPRQSDLALEKL